MDASGEAPEASAVVRGARGRLWPQVPASSASPLHVALAALPLLAFVPVLYYSLTTPFGLIDDYRVMEHTEILDGPRQLSEWIHQQFLEPHPSRYLPLVALLDAVTARIFGAAPWLHHLFRWVLHFASVLLFAAAFLRFRPAPPPAGARPLLPLALLVHVWVFYPNVPAARLAPAEVLSVFFLSLCSWAFACLLRPAAPAARTGSRFGRQTPRAYGLFLLAALGLSLSKETNVAPLLWILIAYGAFLAAEPGSSIGKFARGAPLALVFGFTLSRVHAASQYHETVGLDGFAANLQFILRNLFLLDTSVLLAAVFVLLSAAALLAIAAGFFPFGRFPRTDRRELLFVLFLLGQFFSLYFMIALSPAVAPRYWYVLVPCFAALLAFGARFILFSLARVSTASSRGAAVALAAFVLFFIAVNYHNFLFQTVVQHSLRRAEADMLATVTGLLDAEQRVSIRRKANARLPYVEMIDLVVRHYRDWLPRFRDRKYLKVYSDADGLQADSPPLESDQDRWVVSLYGTPGIGPPWSADSRQGGLRVVDLYAETPFVEDAGMVTIVPALGYRLLSRARTMSGFLQRETPRVTYDFGLHRPGSMLNYGWVVHHAPYGQDEWMARVLSPALEQTGEPVVRSHWDVYVEHVEPPDAARPTRAYLVKEACAPADAEAFFFVDAYGADGADRLHVSFNFWLWGVAAGGRCAAAVELPGHALDRLEVGQDDVWREVVAFR